MLTYVIADIHGRLDHLELALAEIERRQNGEAYRLIFLGDYVDRGPDSRGVIAKIRQLREIQENVIALLGNHEDMFIWERRLEKPTRESYRSTSTYHLDQGQIDADRNWLRSLPLYHYDDIRLYVHAGIIPGVPVDKQIPEHMMWLRLREFFDASREEMGYYVVHGHTIAEAKTTDARCGLDYGGFFYGLLAVGVFNDEQERPIEIFKVGQMERDDDDNPNRNTDG